MGNLLSSSAETPAVEDAGRTDLEGDTDDPHDPPSSSSEPLPVPVIIPQSPGDPTAAVSVKEGLQIAPAYGVGGTHDGGHVQDLSDRFARANIGASVADVGDDPDTKAGEHSSSSSSTSTSTLSLQPPPPESLVGYTMSAPHRLLDPLAGHAHALLGNSTWWVGGAPGGAAEEAAGGGADSLVDQVIQWGEEHEKGGESRLVSPGYGIDGLDLTFLRSKLMVNDRSRLRAVKALKKGNKPALTAVGNAGLLAYLRSNDLGPW